MIRQLCCRCVVDMLDESCSREVPQTALGPREGAYGRPRHLEPPTRQRVERVRVQDEVLILLSSESMHGYRIWSALSAEFSSLRLNTLYRWLNDLEGRRLVSASLEPGVKGPDRRVYELTPAGRQEVVRLLRSAVKIVIDTYRRYRLFSTVHFNRISSAADSFPPGSRILIGSFGAFTDLEEEVVQSILPTMEGERVDFVGSLPSSLKQRPRTRLLKGSLQDISAKNEAYHVIWLLGVPQKKSFGLSMEECRRVLVRGGSLYIVLPYTIDTTSPCSDLGTFISNTVMELMSDLDIMDLQEVQSVLQAYFDEIGSADCRVRLLWARK